MTYLQKTKELQEFIAEINISVIRNSIVALSLPNHLFLKSENTFSHLEMERFSDEYIVEQIYALPGCELFAFTNMVSTQINGVAITYILYKCYSRFNENGFVYYQVVDNDNFSPIGELKFSNFEENIFFKVVPPNFEESSCNALEASESSFDNKKIVFLIGNLNEERLLFDIERLIVTTTFNSKKHSSLTFHYIISISVFGGKKSDEFDTKLRAINKACEAFLENNKSLYFSFEYTE